MSDANPDFNALFFSYFNNSKQQKKRVRFRVRQGADLRHDLQFMSSLIHDAYLDLCTVRTRAGNFIFDIARVRWELFDRMSETPLLLNTSSRIIIGPVRNTSVLYSDPLPCKTLPTAFEITALDFHGYYDMTDEDEWTLCLIGNKVKVRLSLPVYGFRIEVTDRLTVDQPQLNIE